MARATEREDGFSLIELLIAMVVTLIVGGSILALLTSGQSAFRVQPEVTDRQQNVRAAMDRIMRDVESGGVGLPGTTQVFTVGLDSDAVAPAAPGGWQPDELELITNVESDPEPVCWVGGGAAQSGNLCLKRVHPDPDSLIGQSVVIVFSDGPGGDLTGEWTLGVVTDWRESNASASNCLQGERKTCLLFQSSGLGDGVNPPTGLCRPNLLGQGFIETGSLCQVYALVLAETVRYRIRPDANGVPCLERLSTADGSYSGVNPPQVVARGIDDLQVTYRSSADLTSTGDIWTDSPPTIATDLSGNLDYGTLTLEVEVTLGSRTASLQVKQAEPGMTAQGMTVDASGDMALRGSLVSRAAPRMALSHLLTEGYVAPPGERTVTPRWQ